MTGTAAMSLRPSVRFAGRTYPVERPRLADPRMHVAAVIITVQVLGQAVLGFDVSVAQILLCVATAGVLELGLVAATRGVIAWPASALLTGNGVALILRVPGTEHGDWWTTRGWPVFVAAAGCSVLAKYALQVGGRHLFNPSNLGLVVVFLAFGSSHADPQDLWWGPWSVSLALTLLVILVGGITLAVRLRLFSVAVTFWAVFAAGIALLASTGHAMSARWHLGPVAGLEYWLVLVSSPEIVIFVFFMITDPRTAPAGRAARPVYAVLVALLAVVLVAWQTTEFATKVAILLALTVVSAFRPLIEQWCSVEASGGRWWYRRRGRVHPTPVAFGAMAVVLVAAGMAGIAGTGAVAGRNRGEVDRSVTGVGRPPSPRTTASVEVDDAVRRIGGAIEPGDARRLADDLVEDLAIESRARARADVDLAATATSGPRLRSIRRDIARGSTSGVTHQVRRVTVVLLQDPVRPQALPQLGALVEGRVTGVDRRRENFTALFLLSERDGRFLIGEELAPNSEMVVGGAGRPPS